MKNRTEQAWRWVRGALHLKRKPKAAPGVPPPALANSRRAALWVIAALIAAASLVSFAESYRALYDWAAGHGLLGLWAVVWPIQVDVFIAVGELALFVGLAYAWRWQSRLGAWLVTLAGLVVSVAGNVGHVTSHLFTVRATAAVPPIAAASALAVGLGVLKRVVEHSSRGAEDVAGEEYTSTRLASDVLATSPAAQPASAGAPVAASVPGLRRIQRDYECGQPVAKKVQRGWRAGFRAGQLVPYQIPKVNEPHDPAGGAHDSLAAGAPAVVADPRSAPPTAGALNGQAP